MEWVVPVAVIRMYIETSAIFLAEAVVSLIFSLLSLVEVAAREEILILHNRDNL